MQKLRKAMVAVASAAMVLGTMGLGAASAASSTTTCVSRAQFIYAFDVAAGIAPVYPATSDFSDIASSSPYYGYIEAAFKAGYINGTGNGQFSPSGCLTRGQIAKIEVLALGDGAKAAADATSATTFTDDSSIPSWARGYVVEAVALGLVHGYPDGSFAPNATMTATDEGYFLTQYKTTENALSLTVTASASDVAPGQQVTLTATGTSEPVTFSTTAGAVINGSTFVGSTAGTYTVTASTAQGLTGTVKISVYGAAAGLTVNVPSTIVANNASTETVTASVVDANGNVVASNNGDSITIGGYGAALGNPTSATEATVNGVATFTFTAGKVPGATDTLSVADNTPAPNTFTATAKATSTAQVATSLMVTAPQYIGANSAVTDNNGLTVEVDDQTGNPMISGTYSVSASLTGPATFADSTTGPDTSAYVGGLVPTDASFTFDSIQSETGAITFTASGTGLTSGTATTTAVIAGTPTAIQLTAPSTTSQAQGSAPASDLIYNVQVVDSHGYPVASIDTLSASVLNSAGNDATQSVVNGGNLLTVTHSFTNGAGTVTISSVSAASQSAGSYTIQVTGTGADTLTASSTDTFTITANSAIQIAESSPSFVSAASPSATFSAQLEDAKGNSVAEAGVPITFTPNAGNTYPFTNNSAVTVDTNASGVATANFTAPPYTGASYEVDTTSTGLTPSNSSFMTESTIAAGVTVKVENGTTSNPQSVFTAGDPVKFVVTVADQYGTTVTTGDSINVTFGGTGGLLGGATTAPTNLTAGTVTWSDTVTTAGTVTVSVSDTAVAAAPSGSAVLDVNAGGQQGWGLYTADGTLVGKADAATLSPPGTLIGVVDAGGLTVAANTPVELWLKPIDAYGNPVVYGGTPATYAVALTDSHGGTWRTSANGSDVSTVNVTAGNSQTALWYVNANTQTNISLDGDAK